MSAVNEIFPMDCCNCFNISGIVKRLMPYLHLLCQTEQMCIVHLVNATTNGCTAWNITFLELLVKKQEDLAEIW
jgi:hypothetical protein